MSPVKPLITFAKVDLSLVTIFREKAKETFRKIAAEKTVVALGAYRDELDCSRKVALALLEHFDKNGFTRKNGEGRMLR